MSEHTPWHIEHETHVVGADGRPIASFGGYQHSHATERVYGENIALAQLAVHAVNSITTAARTLSVDPLRLAEALEERLGEALRSADEQNEPGDWRAAFLLRRALASAKFPPTPAPTEEP